MRIPETTDATFQADVLERERPVLVDFWGPFCAPCLALAPTLEALANQYAGRVDFVRVRWPDEAGICERYKVTSVPTLMLFHGGEPVDRFDEHSIGGALEARLEALPVSAG